MKQQLYQLKEREKELKCLYRVEALLQKRHLNLQQIFRQLLQIIPPGWQFTEVCRVKITYRDNTFTPDDFAETEWYQQASLIIDDEVEGHLCIYYIRENSFDTRDPFLPEEQKLLNAIAERISLYIFHKRLERTMTYLSTPVKNTVSDDEMRFMLKSGGDQHWKWRLQMAETLARTMDCQNLDVKGIYIIGSTKEGTAGPASDIDLVVHFTGSSSQRQRLTAWVEGWSLCLSEINFLKTGYRIDGGLIDLHIITDRDIAQKNSYAIMIEARVNRARPLRIEQPNT
ncbi:MAG: hypothetical protein GF313_11295 [Caldithrix sp.]|nr:hypothetical protein [Caldithrix sp.]